MKSNKRVHEFKAVELRLRDDSTLSHLIYFKEHIVRDHTKDKPSGRTLFILNIPPYADEKGLINAFRNAGKVLSVQFYTKPGVKESNNHKFLEISQTIKTNFRVCYLVFEKVSELNNALNLNELCPMSSQSHEIKLGIQKWVDEFNNSLLLPKVLKDKVEEFMKSHDEKIKQKEKKDKQLEQEDDEGWVTVTKRGKVQSFARTEKVENKIMTKEENNKKRKELKNFYTFQIRESKMKHIVSLRQKFEEDKRKIAQIKQSRRFKPF